MPCLLLAAALLLLPGCAPAPEGGGELETAEVPAPPDAHLDPERDERAAAADPEGLGGRLPGDFPSTLPVYTPATLVDYGVEEGLGWVALLSPDPPAEVREAYPLQIRAAGWEDAGGASYRLGDRRVRVDILEGRPGTRIVIRYGG